MRLSTFISSISLAAAAAALFAPARSSLIETPGVPDAPSAEIRRIQAHFDSVLVELGMRDLSGLSDDQRARRAELTRTLRAYRDRGVFPHNYDFPGQAVPYFVDRKTGTLCAVAHLLATTGRRGLVDRVALSNNNVWVAELRNDAEFEAWLDANGITLADAARIQVPYANDGSPIVGVAGSREAAYKIGSGVLIAGSAASSLWNHYRNGNGRGTVSTVLGLATGLVGMGYGAAALGDGEAPRAWSAMTLVAGGVSGFISTRGYMRHRQFRAAQRTREMARTVVTPILPLGGKNGVGLGVNVSF